MKINNIYIGLLGFCFLTCLGSCSKTSFIGNWQVQTKGDLEQSAFSFHKNGTLERSSSDKEIHIDNWEYSSKKNELTISSQNEANSSLYSIKYLDALFLVMAKEEQSYTLLRQLKIKSINYNRAVKKLRAGWSLVQLGDKDINPLEKSLEITFWDNGVYQQIINTEIQRGQWVLDDSAKKITLSSADGEQSYGINFLQNKKIELKDAYGSFLFEKSNKIKKTPSNKKIERQIYGAWTIQKIGKKSVDIDYTMYLNSDGVLKIFEDQKVTRVGQWLVSEDGGFLILQYSDYQEMFPIEQIAVRKLKVRDEFETVTFKKIIKF